MAIGVCTCNVGFSNTGVPGCKTLPNVARKHIYVPLFADDGTKNRINLTDDTLNSAYFTALINQADASKRWFPTPKIDNITDERSDPNTQDLDSGISLFVSQGSRDFTGMIIKQSPQYLGKLESFQCGAFGVYTIDLDGSLIGQIVSEGGKDYLEPIPVEEESFYPRYMPKTYSQVPMIQIQFSYRSDVQDSDIRLIKKTEMANFNWLDQNGLLDINVAISSITATGFTATLTLDYGTALDKIEAEGWVAGDFALAETSPSPGSISITSVTESAAGVYDFVIPSQTSGDVLELTASKDGFLFPATSITI